MKLKLLIGFALLGSLGVAHASYILMWRETGGNQVHSVPGYKNEQVCKQAAFRMRTVSPDSFCVPGPDETTPAPDMDMPREDPLVRRN